MEKFQDILLLDVSKKYRLVYFLHMQWMKLNNLSLTLSVPLSCQHPNFSYVTYKNKTYGNEKMRTDETKQTTEG